MILLFMAVSAVVGGMVGWQVRALLAERDQYAREQQRDDEWDATWLSR